MGYFWLLVAAAVVVYYASSSVRVLKDDERLVILRLGRVAGVAGPGRVFLFPIIDKAIRVNLAERVPGWRGMPKGALDSQVVEIALRDVR